MFGMVWVFGLIVSCFILIDLFSRVTFHFLSLCFSRPFLIPELHPGCFVKSGHTYILMKEKKTFTSWV